MRGNRMLTVNLKTGATVAHIIEMLSDVPLGMELTDVTRNMNTVTGQCTATLIFHDWSK